MPSYCRQLALLFAILPAAGCNTVVHKGRSPLLPAQMSADSVVLDLFFVRFPFGDSDVNEKLWGEIDEQQLSPDLRQRLARNGIRAGVVAGQMPKALSKLLELSDKPPPSIEIAGAKIDAEETEPRVTREHLQLPAGKRSEVYASGVYPELPLLISGPGESSGQVYDDAQGIFALKSRPQPEGGVRLQLLPEVHYGQPRRQWVAAQGAMRLDTGRARRAFDDMAIDVDLSPGSMLVISSLCNRPGSLGHYFFTENGGKQQQKLLIVRLTGTQPAGLLAAAEEGKL